MKDRQLLLAMLAQLEREKTVSIPQLASLLGVSEDQVHDALEILVFAYDAAFIRLDLHDSYATLETFGSERLLRLTPQEADVLVDALIGAGFSQDDELVESLLRTKAILDASCAAESSPRTRIVAESGAPHVAQTLSMACEDPEHHLLEISYRGINDDHPETRRVEPVTLFSESGRQYLLAYCLNARDWRSFRVDRISEARPLEDTFVPRKDVPPMGIDFARDTSTASLLLDADCSLPRWRGLKVDRKEADGSCVVSVPWTGSAWLPKHIVALMGKATVIKPDSLARACEEYAHLLLRAANMQER